MSKTWDIINEAGAWAAWLPAAWYGFIRNYPGRAAILWPLSLALAIWWL
jgi:hypothetical protein